MLLRLLRLPLGALDAGLTGVVAAAAAGAGDGVAAAAAPAASWLARLLLLRRPGVTLGEAAAAAAAAPASATTAAPELRDLRRVAGPAHEARQERAAGGHVPWLEVRRQWDSSTIKAGC